MQNKRTFAGQFFELFTLPVSLRLNTHRRIPPSMRAFKEEERSILISVTLMKGITGYKTRSTRSVCKWRVQSWDGYLKERFLSLIVCLFILCYIFLVIHIFRFFFFILFLLSAFFFSIRIFLSAFSHPHPPSARIWSAFYRHPSGNTFYIFCVFLSLSKTTPVQKWKRSMV